METVDPKSPRLDPLGAALSLLGLSETTYFHARFWGTWSFEMPQIPKFHFLTSGRCWLLIEGEPDVLLESGDFVVVPHGKVHRLASEPSARLTDLAGLNSTKVSDRLYTFE